jgi:hypothetical protein
MSSFYIFSCVCFHFVIYFDILFVIKEVYKELTPACNIHIHLMHEDDVNTFLLRSLNILLGKIMLVSRVVSGC